jgi:tRNA G18 (ribose-2'-O)-methylase SpoU
VTKAWKHLPLFHYEAFDAFHKCIPRESLLIGVELVDKSEDIINYVHPERAVYLLGAEDSGLPDKILNKCHRIIQIPGRHCLNVATAGSIILYDRLLKWKN